jgi:hypothetical protein
MRRRNRRFVGVLLAPVLLAGLLLVGVLPAFAGTACSGNCYGEVLWSGSAGNQGVEGALYIVHGSSGTGQLRQKVEDVTSAGDTLEAGVAWGTIGGSSGSGPRWYEAVFSGGTYFEAPIGGLTSPGSSSLYHQYVPISLDPNPSPSWDINIAGFNVDTWTLSGSGSVGVAGIWGGSTPSTASMEQNVIGSLGWRDYLGTWHSGWPTAPPNSFATSITHPPASALWYLGTWVSSYN